MSDPHSLNFDAFQDALIRLRGNRATGRETPHKAVLMLVVLARIARGETGLEGAAASFRFADVEAELRAMLREAGVGPGAQDPFSYLVNERVGGVPLWQVSGVGDGDRRKGGGRAVKAFRPAPLRERGVGAFSPDVAALLNDDPTRARVAIETILRRWFEPGDRSRLRNALRLDLPSVAEPRELGPLPGHDDADPLGADLARERADRSILLRRGQARFRRVLFDAWGERCAMTGCDEAQVLEAAHLKPWCAGGPNQAANGILLRADIHTLFDMHLVSVDASREPWRVAVAPALRCGYRDLHDRAIRLPDRVSLRPNVVLARDHRTACGF